MDPVIVTLRFLHIGGAVAWAGGAFFFLSVLDPMLKKIPPQDAGLIGRHLALRTKMALFFPIGALLTIGAGFALLAMMGEQIDAYSPSQRTIFHLGTGLGLLALVPGIMSGVQSGKMRKDAAAYEAKPSPELGQAMAARGRKLSVLTKVTAGLMVLALFGMSTFRYWV